MSYSHDIEQVRVGRLVAVILLTNLLIGSAVASAAEISAEHADWLEIVELLITDEERDYFLSLEESFRRDAFIEMFWKVRDPYPDTGRNELRQKWLTRVDIVRQEFGSLTDGRSKMLLTNGEPGRWQLPDGRVVARCFKKDVQLEVWFYGGSERTESRFVVLLYRPRFPVDAEYRIWLTGQEVDPERRRSVPVENPADFCDDYSYGWALAAIGDHLSYRNFIEKITLTPGSGSEEWVRTFEAKTTDLPADAKPLEATLAYDFVGRNQSRVAVRGVVTLAAGGVESQRTQEGILQRLLVTGEVVRDDSLFETFRYRFELPQENGAPAPLVFQRYLRPGQVQILLKIEDLLAGTFAHFAEDLVVPKASELEQLARRSDEVLVGRLAEADAAAARSQTTIRILPPPERDIQVGVLRVKTVSAGEFDRVVFYQDGKSILTKRRPPFSVELNLGEIAASHRLRVVAYGDDGKELARDEIVVNQGGQRFRVRLIEPRRDLSYENSLSAVAEVEVPDGQELDRMEIFLNEQRMATLYQEPFVQPVLLTGSDMAYVRAVGYLTDGNTTEHVVFINAPDYFEEIDIHFVELYATVVDRGGKAIPDLRRDDFKVFEDDQEQVVERFEYVRDLPIHAGLLIDTSASMEESLPVVADAAQTFARGAVEPRDRIAVFSFSSRPDLEVRFTNDLEEVAGSLESLRAHGSTAIYDGLVFALHYFDGVKGPKALLLLSDGKDESSRFDFEGALAVAHRIGVTVYVIGLKGLSKDRDAKKLLRRIARETGGRSFFIEELDELPAIYAAIEADLRSQYLLAYQSTSTKGEAELRVIRVEADRRGSEVRTLTGYYP